MMIYNLYFRNYKIHSIDFSLVILIIICICFANCKWSKKNGSASEEDREVTVITTTTTTVYPEYGMYIPPQNASNVRVPSPTPSQKSYVPPAVYPAAPGTNSSTSNNLSVPSAPPSYQSSLTKPYDPVDKVLWSSRESFDLYKTGAKLIINSPKTDVYQNIFTGPLLYNFLAGRNFV